MRPHDEVYWIPILPSEMRERLKTLPANKRQWPKAFLDEYKRLHSEFTKAKAAFIEVARRDRDTRMSPRAFKALSFLIDCLNFDTGRCDPSQQTIADEVGVHVATAERVIRKLKAAGWIEIYRRGATSTNFYRIGAPKAKIDAIKDDAEARRQVRKSAWEALNLLKSDPAKMRDHSPNHPAKMRDHEPAKMMGHDPAKMRDKPLKGTSEAEPLNESSCDHGGEGTYKGKAYSSSEVEEKTSATIITPDFSKRRIA